MLYEHGCHTALLRVVLYTGGQFMRGRLDFSIVSNGTRRHRIFLIEPLSRDRVVYSCDIIIVLHVSIRCISVYIYVTLYKLAIIILQVLQ